MRCSTTGAAPSTPRTSTSRTAWVSSEEHAMTDRTSSRLPRVALVALAGILAAAGWLAGMATRAESGAPAPAPSALASPSRPPLPQLAPAGASSEAVDVFHPRPAHEWQGMLVDLSQRQ